MRKFNNHFKDFAYFLYRWISQVVDPVKMVKGPLRFFGYFCDWMKYSNMEGSEAVKIIDTYPCLHDKTQTSPFDHHYFYQDIWAFRKVFESGVTHHIDVGSRVDLVGFLTTIVKVTFIDIRPLEVSLENFESKKGSVLSLPYEDGSVISLSCLHVAEHVGLGRYGDHLDPLGTKKAAGELSRILARNGNLYFSLPIGKPRVCFNAHRVHSIEQILDYFSELRLVELSGIDDQGRFMKNIEKSALNSCSYGCGLFWF